MLTALDRWITRLPRNARLTLAIVLLAMVGCVDLLTGYEVSVGFFYLFPICMAAWYAGSRPGRVLALTGAVVWFLADAEAGRLYSNDAIRYWNASIRFGFFFTGAVAVSRIRELLEVQTRASEIDGLTGLLNSQTFEERVSLEAARARRYGRPFAISYLDLDNFKVVNDTHGHSVGDDVLKRVATELLQRTRPSDCCARLGGDEFAVLLPETDVEGAEAFGQSLCSRVRAHMEYKSWPVSLSIGTAVFGPEIEATVDEMLHASDQLMYEAKKAGKNRVMTRRSEIPLKPSETSAALSSSDGS
jgi:diguanylate cyclase (GGDEF)-like protein